MMKILTVQTGIFGDQSNSTQLAKSIADRLGGKAGMAESVVRDLSTEPLPYFDAQVAMALNSEPTTRDEAQNAIVALSDSLIEEVKNADAIVLGVPMYNFGIPAQMKSWFDLIARAGVTFKYTETGPVGMLEDKPVYVAMARGGVHQGKPSDTQTSYLQTMLGFLGLKTVKFAYAEGLAMGEEAKATSFENFETEVSELA